jgi:hypothetical protein
MLSIFICIGVAFVMALAIIIYQEAQDKKNNKGE